MKKFIEEKKTILIILGILLVLAIIGTSYAWWTTSAFQTGENAIISNCLKLHIVDETHAIHLKNAFPISDEEGERLEPYTFTVENECDIPADYSIALEMLNATELNSNYLKYELNDVVDEYVIAIEDSYTEEYPTLEECQDELQWYVDDDYYTVTKSCELESIDDENKYILDYSSFDYFFYQTNEECQNGIIELLEEGAPSSIQCEVQPVEKEEMAHNLGQEREEEKVLLTDAKEGRLLRQDTVAAKASKSYNLRLWMDYDTPLTEEAMNKIFQSKIVLQAVVAESGMLKKIRYDENYIQPDSTGMWEYYLDIDKIIIEDTIYKPEGIDVLGPFDESSAQDGSIVSYLVPDESGDGTYVAHLQGNDGIKLNSDSSYLFADFRNVKAIEGIEYLDTSEATNMRGMFMNMASLTQLNLEKQFDTSNVVNMSFMFGDSNGYLSVLSNLDLSKCNFDTSNVTDMNNMFSGLQLDTLNLGDKFNTSQVTNMAGMFRSTLIFDQNIDLGELFDTSSVTNMTGMFQSFGGNKELNLGNKFNTSNVRNMDSMFKNSLVRTLNLGEQFDTSNVTNMSNMFSGMRNLTQLSLGDKFNTSKVRNMSSMFNTVSSLENLDLRDKFDTSQVTDMSWMFNNMSSLIQLDLGNQFDTSKVTDMSYMFAWMIDLYTLNLGDNFNTSNVVNMSFMFYYSSRLKTINYGDNFVRKDGSDITNMFQSCPAEKPEHSSWAGAFD